jgi:hypothetical protein
MDVHETWTQCLPVLELSKPPIAAKRSVRCLHGKPGRRGVLFAEEDLGRGFKWWRFGGPLGVESFSLVPLEVPLDLRHPSGDPRLLKGSGQREADHCRSRYHTDEYAEETRPGSRRRCYVPEAKHSQVKA